MRQRRLWSHAAQLAVGIVLWSSLVMDWALTYSTQVSASSSTGLAVTKIMLKESTLSGGGLRYSCSERSAPVAPLRTLQAILSTRGRELWMENSR